MDKKLGAGIALVAIMALVFGAMFVSGSFSATGDAVKVASDRNAGILKTTTVEPTVKEFVMESYTEIIDGKYYPKFSPEEITVNKGDKVRIRITNTKGTHDFKIDEFGVYTETPLNQEMTVEFVADKAGSFEYYCTKPGHRQNGHWGTLKVLE